MSVENATAFIDRVKSDSEFRDQVAGFENKEDSRAFVLSAIGEFTREELEQVKKSGGSEELSDGDLEQVVGGGGSFWEWLTSCGCWCFG